MKGTEKQIKYANDILDKAHARVEKIIEKKEKAIERDKQYGCLHPKAYDVLAKWKEVSEIMLEDETWENASDVIEQGVNSIVLDCQQYVFAETETGTYAKCDRDHNVLM